MQKEIIIIIIVLILIFSIDAICQNYTINNVSVINKQLEEIKEFSNELEKEELNENSKEEKTKELTDKIAKLKSDWKQMNTKMSLYVEHDELEKVNTSLVKVNSYLLLEEYTEGITELENCMYILEHIKDKGTMRIINLF